MLSVLGFLIILGPLVIVHEFGHYLFAKLFNVKAEIFSVGFGPRLWAKKIGETEWRVSAIPLGGYVKLLGEERDSPLPPEEAKRALHRQEPWKRFFIFFGGPLFNFLMAIVIFMAILVIGEPQMASVVGRVVDGSHAEKIGFRSGDRILAIDGVPVTKFEEVLETMNDSPGKELKFTVQHAGSTEKIALAATPKIQDGYSIYGESTDVGEIDGLLPAARAAVVGVSDPASTAAKAGFKTGDKIVELNGSKLTSWEDFEAIYKTAAPGTSFRMRVVDRNGASPRDIELKRAPGEHLAGTAWGLFSSELFVDKPVAKSPAEVAGVVPGDRLIGVGPRTVQSFYELKDAVQSSGEKDGKVVLRWEHEGQLKSATLDPTGTSGRDPNLRKTTQFTVGVVPLLSFADPETIIERVWNPFLLLYKGTERMVVFSYRNFVSIKKMFTGDVSVGTLGGPIMIGKIAGESLSRGLIAFLTTMAMLSIGLGVLNILPVPVLDGGHLLLLGIEAIRGKPLSIRQMEIIQGVGLTLILLLMGVVIRNDITRSFFN